MFHEILEDSWSYQEMVQKGLDVGLEQGLQKGLEQGELIAARSFLARIIEKHFPPLLPLARRKAEHLKSVSTLNSVIDKLLEAQTMEQAREVLEEDAQ
jgi:hypothetical protein